MKFTYSIAMLLSLTQAEATYSTPEYLRGRWRGISPKTGKQGQIGAAAGEFSYLFDETTLTIIDTNNKPVIKSYVSVTGSDVSLYSLDDPSKMMFSLKVNSFAPPDFKSTEVIGVAANTSGGKPPHSFIEAMSDDSSGTGIFFKCKDGVKRCDFSKVDMQPPKKVESTESYDQVFAEEGQWYDADLKDLPKVPSPNTIASLIVDTDHQMIMEVVEHFEVTHADQNSIKMNEVVGLIVGGKMVPQQYWTNQILSFTGKMNKDGEYQMKAISSSQFDQNIRYGVCSLSVDHSNTFLFRECAFNMTPFDKSLTSITQGLENSNAQVTVSVTCLNAPCDFKELDPTNYQSQIFLV